MCSERIEYFTGWEETWGKEIAELVMECHIDWFVFFLQ